LGEGVTKTPQEILYNKGSSQTVLIGLPTSNQRYDLLSMQSHPALYNMRYPAAAINPVSTNTHYNLRMSPKILLNSLNNRIKKYFPMKVLS
jgi:hypothetical protein